MQSVLVFLLFTFTGDMGQSASSGKDSSCEFPVVGEESIMSDKEHGTCTHGVMDGLRWGCEKELADRICCFNRHYAEHAGYFSRDTDFIKYAVSVHHIKLNNLVDCSINVLPLFVM